LATPLAFLLASRVDAWLNPQASPTSGVGVLILTVPFAAAAVGALPQGLVLQHRDLWGDGGTRLLAWLSASALGGLLPLGYVFDDTNQPTLTDVLHWYLPVTLVVAGLVATAQTRALRAVVPRRGTRSVWWYAPMTVLGWALGWPIALLSLSGGRTTSMVLGILWYGLPWGIIGMFSGAVVSGFPSNRAAAGTGGRAQVVTTPLHAPLDD
jgi:hypothetical protein